MPHETFGFGLILVLLLCLLAWRDLREMRLPNVLTGALALFGIAQAVWIGDPSLPEALSAAVFAGLLLYGVFIFYRRWRGVDGLGLGDIKFAAAGALWCGFGGVGPMLLVASLCAGMFAGARGLRTGSLNAKERFPFGPYLAMGIFAAWVLTRIDFSQSPY